jgi:hypothetical protein
MDDTGDPTLEDTGDAAIESTDATEPSHVPGPTTNHLAYATRNGRGPCPPGFPHKLSALRMTITWDYQGDGSDIELSSSDSQYSMHADFWNTWEQPGLEDMLDRCVNNPSAHPHGSGTVCGGGAPPGLRGGSGANSSATGLEDGTRARRAARRQREQSRRAASPSGTRSDDPATTTDTATTRTSTVVIHNDEG